jgi:hypothetical protein
MRVGIAVITAAACMVSISAFGQSSKSSSKAQKQSMTLTGCLIGESDYKRAQQGKGNSGSARADDEFVLADASEASSASAAGSCTATASGKAYRLVGKHKNELKSLVGRRIEITGAFEEKRDAQIAAGEKKSSLPPEIEVASVRELTASASPAPASVTASAAPAPPAAAPAPAPSPEPVATEARNETPSREALPKTASNLPLIGLIGLISLCAAFGLRLTRPRMS